MKMGNRVRIIREEIFNRKYKNGDIGYIIEIGTFSGGETKYTLSMYDGDKQWASKDEIELDCPNPPKRKKLYLSDSELFIF